MKKLSHLLLGIGTYSLIIFLFTAYDHDKTHIEINHVMTAKFLERVSQTSFASGKFKNYTFNWSNSSAPSLSGPALDNDHYLSYSEANEPSKSMNPISWISQGGWMEDNPWATAAIRHFYDPLAIDDGKKYLTDRSSRWETIVSPVSSYYTYDAETWAYDHPDNKYSWKKAKEYFIKALREENQSKKNEYMALAYRSLGQVLHLVADMGCPPHVRNDSHPPNFYASDALSEGMQLIKVMGDPDPYEDLVKNLSVQSLVNNNSPNSNLATQFSSSNSFKNIFEKMAYFTNQRIVTNQTIATLHYKQIIRPDNPYPQPTISEAEYNSGDFTYYKYYDGQKIKMCKDKTPLLFGTKFGRGMPFVDFDCVKSQASLLMPNIAEAGINVIRLFVPSLKIEVTKALADSGGIVRGKISYTLPSANDEYSGLFDLSNIYNGPVKLKVNSSEVNVNASASKNNFEIKLNNALSNLKKGDKAEVTIEIGGIVIKSDQAEFTGNKPEIISIDPSSIKVNETMTINGKYFGNSSTAGKVYFNSLAASEIVSWNDTKINVKVPNDAQSGYVYVKVNQDESNKVSFTIINDNPVINSIVPSTAKIGDEVKISGDNFGDSKQNGYVNFTGAIASSSDIISWSKKEIIVKVPQGTQTGDVFVFVNSIKSNGYLFTLEIPKDVPKITSFYPEGFIFNVNQVVTIYGEKFGYDKNKIKIDLNGFILKDDVIQTSTSSYIIFIVPAGAKSGPLKVIVDGVSSNSVDVKIRYFYYKMSNNTVDPALGAVNGENDNVKYSRDLQENSAQIYFEQKSTTSSPGSYSIKMWWDKPPQMFYSHDTTSLKFSGELLSFTGSVNPSMSMGVYVDRLRDEGDYSQSTLVSFGINKNDTKKEMKLKLSNLRSLTTVTPNKKIVLKIFMQPLAMTYLGQYYYKYYYDLYEEFQ